MWEFAVWLWTAITAELIRQIIAGVVIAAMAVWWDEWGRDLITILGAVVAIVGLIWYGLGVYGLIGGFEVTAYDLIIIIIGAVLGAPLLADWLVDVVDWLVTLFVEIVAAVVKALSAAIPWTWVALGVGAYLLLSNNSNSASSYQAHSDSGSWPDDEWVTDELGVPLSESANRQALRERAAKEEQERQIAVLRSAFPGQTAAGAPYQQGYAPFGTLRV
jgi:hypothetical protein